MLRYSLYFSRISLQGSGLKSPRGFPKHFPLPVAAVPGSDASTMDTLRMPHALSNTSQAHFCWTLNSPCIFPVQRLRARFVSRYTQMFCPHHALSSGVSFCDLLSRGPLGNVFFKSSKFWLLCAVHTMGWFPWKAISGITHCGFS